MKSAGSRTIIIAGMPCSGKSSVSRELKKNISHPVLDLDEAIEERAGRPVKDIIRVDGIVRFREVESSTLLECLNARPSFLSLGGGALTIAKNFKAIASANATLVTLTASLSQLVQRAACDEELAGTSFPTRPLLFSVGEGKIGLRPRMSALLIERWKYLKLAELVISTSFSSPKQVAEVMLHLENLPCLVRGKDLNDSSTSVIVPLSGGAFLGIGDLNGVVQAVDGCVCWRDKIIDKVLALDQSSLSGVNQSNSAFIKLDIPAVVSDLKRCETGEDVAVFNAEQLCAGMSPNQIRVLDVWPLIEEVVYTGFNERLALGGESQFV